MSRIVLLLAMLLLVSCAQQHPSAPALLRPETHSPAQLQRISISSLGEQRFTGLLGLRATADTLDYVLLDPMGVTVLRGMIRGDGRNAVTGGIPKVVESRLPGLLENALSRMFLAGAETSSCDGLSIGAIREKRLDGKGRMKYFRIGPFTAWQVSYQPDGIVYAQPWFGLKVTLTPIDVR